MKGCRHPGDRSGFWCVADLRADRQPCEMREKPRLARTNRHAGSGMFGRIPCRRSLFDRAWRRCGLGPQSPLQWAEPGVIGPQQLEPICPLLRLLHLMRVKVIRRQRIQHVGVARVGLDGGQKGLLRQSVLYPFLLGQNEVVGQAGGSLIRQFSIMQNDTSRLASVAQYRQSPE